MTTPIYLLGTGSYIPEAVITNFDLEKLVDTSDEWIVTRTGIRERHEAAPEQACSDLALPASRAALDQAGLEVADIGLIVMATVTPDMQCPAGANWLQAHLGADRALTFDVTAGCSGFVFALHVAEKYLRCGFCENVLVVASGVMTRTVDWTDRASCILWGDGAGAVVLSTTPKPGAHALLSVHAHSDGKNGQSITLPGGGSKTTPFNHESIDQKRHYLRLIEANLTLRVAVQRFADSINEAMEANDTTIADVDMFIPHQANLRMITQLAKKLKLGMERFYVTIHKHGNMSSASCPSALDESGPHRRDQARRPGLPDGFRWRTHLGQRPDPLVVSVRRDRAVASGFGPPFRGVAPFF